ncbi:MAG: UPF0280 family protein [Rhodobacteraceae bacterium]|nr:UPF0280 family protein [Paracoccaceae bacterium]
MTGPVAALLDGGLRLHLQHGPIDLIIGADPAPGGSRQQAFEAAADRFGTILDELVAELPLLRCAVGPSSPRPAGAIAQRMDAAVRRLPTCFVTPMAAVAGAVADAVLAAMLAAVPLGRAYVNNGGDIALHLAPGQVFTLAMAGLDQGELGRIAVASADRIGGIATSGQGGRSLSLGIAGSVTVLAADAATADAAATLVANAVDLPDHPGIRRIPARVRQPDSDLGDRPVVTHVGPLTSGEIHAALRAGAVLAEDYRAAGLIAGAALSLRGTTLVVGSAGQIEIRKVEHA